MARSTTTWVITRAALLAICAIVSSKTPAGALAKASWVGSAAWHGTQCVFISARISSSVGGAGNACPKAAVAAVTTTPRTVAVTPEIARARSDETESLRRAIGCSLAPLAIRAFTQQPVEDERAFTPVFDGLLRERPF